jgi:Heterokaryon incompatibility protein (HET)
LLHFLRRSNFGDSFNPGQAWQRIVCGDERHLQDFEASPSSTQLISHRLLKDWISESDDNVRTRLMGSKKRPPGPDCDLHMSNLFAIEFMTFSNEALTVFPEAVIQVELLRKRCEAAMHALSKNLIERCRKIVNDGSLLGVNQLSTRHYNVPVNIESCEWLKSNEPYYPFYLWDVKKQQTCETSEIRAQEGIYPPYVAISHTWGRWKLRDKPWVRLTGVPWKIPANSRFRVEDLPESLKSLQTDYVWMDLLTIPQENEPADMLVRKNIEISKQAQIFKSASSAVAWFPEVTDWKEAQATMAWICLNVIRRQKPVYTWQRIDLPRQSLVHLSLDPTGNMPKTGYVSLH